MRNTFFIYLKIYKVYEKIKREEMREQGGDEYVLLLKGILVISWVTIFILKR